MAMGKYTRIDRKKTSGYCSTATIVLIVLACLIGGWVMMPSSPGEGANGEGLTKGEKLQQVNENYTREYENILGHLGSDAVKGNDEQEDVKDESDSDVQRNENKVEESRNSVGELFAKTMYDDSEMVESNEGKEAQGEKDSKGVEQESLGNGENNTGDSGARSSEEEESERIVDHETAHIGDEQSEVQDISNDIKQDEETESKTEEVAEHDDVDGKAIDNENSDGKELQGGEENQNQESSNDDGNEKTTESGTEDRADTLEEMQSGGSESERSPEKFSSSGDQHSYSWKLCKTSAGPDYIPCLDNIKAIRKLRTTAHYEHQERHCPDEPPTCLVPLPQGYRIPVKWPKSREKVWFANVPHTKLAEVKGHQNWVHVSGEYLTFPGGGTQFTHGAMRYIDFIQKTVADISWGRRTRVVLDVGCGVASFGGYLLDKNVITMSVAPKDVHEAQVQFALERGIPAITAVMGTKRLPFPDMVFDAIHCARCRISWHIEGGKLLLELDRLLRPGGYFVWSATPVYRKDPEDVGIWKAMSKLTKSMCWELVRIGKDKVNGVGVAIFRKPTTNDCYESRKQNDPPMCQESEDANSTWYEPLEACIHEVPTERSKRGSQWPTKWPSRLVTPPYWLKDSEVAPEDFNDDYKHWKLMVANSYLDGIGIDWSSVRNVMDMNAFYGGFAAALKDMQLWVMNVVPVVDSSDTLPIIYERGLIGVHHDWCEAFNTYPRTYDLLHANHLFSNVKKRCNFVAVMAEVDRILRPEGWLVVRDDAETLNEVESIAKSLHWNIQFTYSKDNQGLLCVRKTRWRPSQKEIILSAIA